MLGGVELGQQTAPGVPKDGDFRHLQLYPEPLDIAYVSGTAVVPIEDLGATGTALIVGPPVPIICETTSLVRLV